MTPMTPTPTSGVEWKHDPMFEDWSAIIEKVITLSVFMVRPAEPKYRFKILGRPHDQDYDTPDLAKAACLKRAGEIGAALVKASGGEDEANQRFVRSENALIDISQILNLLPDATAVRNAKERIARHFHTEAK